MHSPVILSCSLLFTWHKPNKFQLVFVRKLHSSLKFRNRIQRILSRLKLRVLLDCNKRSSTNYVPSAALTTKTHRTQKCKINQKGSNLIKKNWNCMILLVMRIFYRMKAKKIKELIDCDNKYFIRWCEWILLTNRWHAQLYG